MKTKEGKLKDQVKTFLKEKGAYYHMPVSSGYGSPTLDFVGCYKGRFFAIETKAPGKKPTARQQATINAMKTAGGFALWTNNISDLEERWRNWFGPAFEVGRLALTSHQGNTQGNTQGK